MTAAYHFPLLGEPLALDLVNTRVRRDHADLDLLDSPSALAAWLHLEPPRLAWSGSAGEADLRAVPELRHALAADAVSVLTGPAATRLRVCAHPDCVLQFVALNPRRRWCSTAVCGNRARVARHYQRQRADS